MPPKHNPDSDIRDAAALEAPKTGIAPSEIVKTDTAKKRNPEAASESAASSLARGTKVISGFVKRLPARPGVYRMLGDDGVVLYVGKAKNLPKRVQSYTRATGHTHRIMRMIALTRDMEFVTTSSETEALLLEANLIKQLKPQFNVLLRDDKSFPHILIAKHDEAPQILKHRGARKRKGQYFGPFASAGAVNRALNVLQRAFLLRSCTDSVYDSRSRPCLLYQIKRCSAPCTGEITPEDYAVLVKQAVDFLNGRSGDIRRDLTEKMEGSSEVLDFERAAIYRDRLAALSHVQSHQGINPHHVWDGDVVSAYQEGGMTCIQIFFFRNGQNWGNHAYYPRADKSLPTAEVLSAFLAQFYVSKPCPPLIMLSETVPDQALLEEALSSRLGRTVRVKVPKRGEKLELVNHAMTNAREALGRHLAETSTQKKLLEGFAKVFGLEDPPARIEVYDNSHIQGTNAVGAMIVAGPDGFEKNQYRKYNIKSEDLVPGDDYGMMREVLTRRFKRLQKENGDDEQGNVASVARSELPAWPDIVLIDGGVGQLQVGVEVLEELGIDNVALVGIAKGPDRDAGRERFFMPGREAFMLQPRDPVLYFVQRLRDESHRFAIGTHRAKRKKTIGRSPLDEIPGIGPTRKRALLQHFGSARAVSKSGKPDLETVEGISAQMAQTIYDFFHEQSH